MTTNKLSEIKIIDGLLYTPERYRAHVLAQDFKDEPTPAGLFKGISKDELGIVPAVIQRKTGLTFSSHISFIRKSPLGQREPNFIHNDVDMGDVTSVLYLTPEPPEGDGTDFWKDVAGDHRGPWSQDHRGPWIRWQHVEARFNRLVLFPTDYYHSRAIEANYGEGDNSRLVQVTIFKY